MEGVLEVEEEDVESWINTFRLVVALRYGMKLNDLL